MHYCPYCAATLVKSTKICPVCNKSLDIDLLSHLYRTNEGTEPNRRIARKIWLQEHAFAVLPLAGMVIGLLIGILLAFGYSKIQSASEQSQLEEKIAALQDSIKLQIAAAGSATADLQNNLKDRKEIITILNEQIQILVKIINFTRRFASNSIISTPDEQEIGTYRRNVLYLINQYNEQQEKLKQAGQVVESELYLITIPHVFEQQE
jgi:uncharacterized membrane-anchored protein YhcB (DUF1043 family)